MKKRCLVIAAVGLVLLLSGVAAAAGGSQSDPLVSKSYLEGTFAESLSAAVTKTVTQGTQAVWQAALDKLDQMGKAYLTQVGGVPDGAAPDEDWNVSQSFTPGGGEKADSVTLSAGSGLLWTSGTATVSGVLVDVTAGQEVAEGGTVQTGHRYLAAEQTVITVTSRTAHWSVEGQWSTTSDGISVVELPFTDVPEGSWYYDAVCYVYERGLYAGMSPTEFAPGQSMQRGMMTTVLHRMAGTPHVEYAPIFTDVPEGLWYTEGTIWAGQQGVVSGIGDGLFAPQSDVQRQQIAVILYNYTRSLGKDVSARGDLTAFPDSGSVAGWAEEAMSWAVGSGILTGSDGKLLPASSATRAQVAIMLQRFQSLLGETT